MDDFVEVSIKSIEVMDVSQPSCAERAIVFVVSEQLGLHTVINQSVNQSINQLLLMYER